MPDCNSRIRVKFVGGGGYGPSSWGGGVFHEYGYETSQSLLKCFPTKG